MTDNREDIGGEFLYALNSFKELLAVQKANGLSGFHRKERPAAEEAKRIEIGSLDKLRETLMDCRLCRLSQGRKNIVFGEGDPMARLMFIGEGPGEKEDESGRPFVGAAGELLSKMITAMGIDRNQVYITNIVKCRPPKNRDPEEDEVEQCLPFLLKQIEIIQPEVICCLGRVATHNLLQVDTPITKIRGGFQKWQGIQVMPTYHPAYLLHNPKEKRSAWEDLQKIMKVLNLSLPNT